MLRTTMSGIAAKWSQRPTARCTPGKSLQSNSLPRSDDLQGALKAINDSFAHPNPSYYLWHTSLSELEGGEFELKLRFFDDDPFHCASVLSLLHLLITTQDALA